MPEGAKAGAIVKRPAPRPVVAQVAGPARSEPASEPIRLAESETLTAPAALDGEVKARVRFPWLLEGSLAAALAVGIAASGIATTTTELATILFSVSLTGLLALLACEAVNNHRWEMK